MSKTPVKINLKKTDAFLLLLLMLMVFLFGLYELLFNRPQYSSFAIAATLLCGVGILATLFGFTTLVSNRFEYTGEAKSEPDTALKISVTDTGVICTYSHGGQEKINWKDVVKVQVLTTDEGPYVCDVFFVLTDANDKGVAVPQDNPECEAVLNHISSWEGYNHAVMIEAMGSAEVKWFTVWEKKNQTLESK